MTVDRTTHGPDPNGEPSLSQIIALCLKHKRLLLGVPFLAAVVTALITLLLPNIYTGRSVLLPPQQQQSAAAAMLGQLGALANVAGAALPLKNPNDLYVGMLKSRSIADRLIERFQLQQVYETDTLDATRKALARRTSMVAGRDGLIIVQVEDRDPQRAAMLTNAYVEELTSLTSRLAVTEAAQRRLFFEKQLKSAKEDLAKLEDDFRATQERTGLVKIDEQGRATIEALAELRARIVAKEVELSAIRLYATEGNPDLLRVQRELAALRSELKKASRGSDQVGDVFLSTSEIPVASLEYLRKYRDVKFAEAVVEVLLKQYEIARVDEAKDLFLIQVVDKAVVPDEKSGPPRALIILSVTLLSGLLTAITIALRYSFRRL